MSLALRTQELQITGTNQIIGCEEVQVNCTGGGARRHEGKQA